MEPTPEQIAEWKLAHGQIYSAQIRGREYIFRSLTFHEFDRISQFSKDEFSSAEMEEYVAGVALLYPNVKTISHNMAAGVVSVICNEIQNVSGYGSPLQARDILDEKRSKSADIRNLMKAYILSAMPAYKEDELDFLNFSQLAAKVALAEQIISIQQGIMAGNQITLEIVDPDEEARQKLKHTVSKRPGTASYDDPVAQRLRTALGG